MQRTMLTYSRGSLPSETVRATDLHTVGGTTLTSSRGSKLADQDLFTGEVWVGPEAIEVGLADGIGHLVPKMKEMFGDKVRLNVIGQRKSLFQRFGIGAASDVLGGIEDRTDTTCRAASGCQRLLVDQN